MITAANGRRTLLSPGLWISIATFAIGVCRVSSQARFWPSSQSYASRVAGFLLEGLALAVAAGLILGVLYWSLSRVFRASNRTPLTTGCVWGFNFAVIALFWIMPAFI